MNRSLFFITLTSWSLSVLAGNLPQMEVVEDAVGTLKAEDIFRLPSHSMRAADTLNLNLHLTTWFRLILPPATNPRYLNFSKGIDSLLLFSHRGLEAVTGKDVTPSVRSERYSTSALRLPPGRDTFVIKGVNYSSNFKFDTSKNFTYLLFPDERSWLNHLQQVRATRSIYASGQRGFLVLLGLVTLLTGLAWAVLHDRAFGRYALYVAAIFFFYLGRRLHTFDFDGIMARDSFRYTFELFWIPVIVITYAYFIHSLLSLEKEPQDTRLNNALRWVIWCALGVLVTTLILLLITDLTLTNRFGVFSRLVLIAGTFYVIILILLRPDPLSRIAAGGAGILILGMVLILANDYSKMRYGISFEPSPLSFFQYGVIGELVLYGAGLIYRWRHLKTISVNREHELQELRRRVAKTERGRGEKWLVVYTPRRQYQWPRTQVQGFVANRELSNCLLTEDRTMSIPLRLGELEEQLPEEFVRVQRSFIVNLNHVVRFDDGKQPALYLTGRTQPVPVGKSLRKTVRRALEDFRG